MAALAFTWARPYVAVLIIAWTACGEKRARGSGFLGVRLGCGA